MLACEGVGRAAYEAAGLVLEAVGHAALPAAQCRPVSGPRLTARRDGEGEYQAARAHRESAMALLAACLSRGRHRRGATVASPGGAHTSASNACMHTPTTSNISLM